MRTWALWIIGLLAALGAHSAALAQTADKTGCKDHPSISRFAGAIITECGVGNFDEFIAVVRQPAGGRMGPDNTQTLAGKVTSINYMLGEGATALEAVENYRAALAASGYETVFDCARATCNGVKLQPTRKTRRGEVAFDGQQRALLARKTANTGVSWVSVFAGTAAFNRTRQAVELDVIEEKPLTTGQVTIDAAALGSGLGGQGKVALYGIYFDTGKADLKPDSSAQLGEIAKLLGVDPSLSLYVVGHTDSQGAFAANVDLSKRRAAAVVAALVGQYRIAAPRLQAEGVGQLAPVTSNATEEGRAKNRRVEIVAR